MLSDKRIGELKSQGRYREEARTNDEDLGPLALLPGRWHSDEQGWNMIALPSATEPPPAGFDYRLLMNQYTEDLTFSLVDKGIPNRGIRKGSPSVDTDQILVALDYQQSITQDAAADFPKTDKVGEEGLAIHHEPGLWLHMTNETTDGLDIARLASIPHGNTVLALGRSRTEAGAPNIPVLNGLPFGAGTDTTNPYLAPYKFFNDDPFRGKVPIGVPGFPGFHPSDLHAILNFANEGKNISKTFVLEVDTTLEKAGINNIPFIEAQADAASMKSTFWISEVKDADGDTSLQLQYSQIVMLDFFRPRRDGMPGPVRWPHVSINTMTKVS